MKTKKKAAKKARTRGKPAERSSPRELTREQWEALFLGPSPTSRVAARSDTDIGSELGLTRQAIRKRRESLKIEPYVRPPAEIVTPAEDAPLRAVVGWRIAIHQQRHGWTNEQIATALGGSWNPSSIGVVKHGETGQGRRTLTPETLQQIAGVLLVSPADLLLLPGQSGFSSAAVEVEWERLGGLKDPPLRSVIGCNIAAWRLFRDLTQLELAARVSEHHGTWASTDVSHVEHGKTRATGGRGIMLESLAVFAKALEITPADLARLPRQPALVPVKSG
jgi:transcriptional regulator with XRE-family HTH domain